MGTCGHAGDAQRVGAQSAWELETRRKPIVFHSLVQRQGSGMAGRAFVTRQLIVSFTRVERWYPVPLVIVARFSPGERTDET